MIEIAGLIEVAKYAALEAGEAILNIYRTGIWEKVIKPDKSPVTLADKKSHLVLLKHLKKTNLPVISEEGANMSYGERKYWKYFWLIDPLDGTKEFINGNGEFTVNIALVKRNTPVAGVIYAPLIDTLYSGSKETGISKLSEGKMHTFTLLPARRHFSDLLLKECLVVLTSRSHTSLETNTFINQFQNVSLIKMGSSLKFMLLVENKADIYPRMVPTMEWDTAAAHAILNLSNRGIYHTDLSAELSYNKPDLKNPFFIAF